jgi:hypothetical protein
MCLLSKYSGYWLGEIKERNPLTAIAITFLVVSNPALKGLGLQE